MRTTGQWKLGPRGRFAYACGLWCVDCKLVPDRSSSWAAQLEAWPRRGYFIREGSYEHYNRMLIKLMRGGQTKNIRQKPKDAHQLVQELIGRRTKI